MYSSWIDFVSLRIDDLMFLWRWGFLISTGSLEKGCSTSMRSIQTCLIFTVCTSAISLNLKDLFWFAMACQIVQLDSLWLWRLLLLDKYSLFLKLGSSSCTDDVGKDYVSGSGLSNSRESLETGWTCFYGDKIIPKCLFQILFYAWFYVIEPLRIAKWEMKNEKSDNTNFPG
jgi:hypothetical protein